MGLPIASVNPNNRTSSPLPQTLGTALDLQPISVEIPLNKGVENRLSLPDLNLKTNYVVNLGREHRLLLNRDILGVYNQQTTNPDGSQTLRNPHGGSLTLKGDTVNLSFFDNSPAVVNTPNTPSSVPPSNLPTTNLPTRYSALGIDKNGLYAQVPTNQGNEEPREVVTRVGPGTQGVVNPTGTLGQGSLGRVNVGAQIEVSNMDKPPVVSPLWDAPVTVKQNDIYSRTTLGGSAQGLNFNQGDILKNPGYSLDNVTAFNRDGTNVTLRTGITFSPDDNKSSVYHAGRFDLLTGERIRYYLSFDPDAITGLIQYRNSSGFDFRLAGVIPNNTERLNYSADVRFGQPLPYPGNFIGYDKKVQTPFIFGGSYSHQENPNGSSTDTINLRAGYAFRDGSYFTVTGSRVDNSASSPVTTLTFSGAVRLGGDPNAQPPTGSNGITSGVNTDALFGKDSGSQLSTTVGWNLDTGDVNGRVTYANWWQGDNPGNVVVQAGYNTATERLNINADAAARVIDNPGGHTGDVYLQAGAGLTIDPNRTNGEVGVGASVMLNENTAMNVKVHVPLNGDEGKGPKISGGFTWKF